MKIKSKLIVGFGSLTVLIIISSGISYFFISDLDRIVNQVGEEAQEAIDLELYTLEPELEKIEELLEEKNKKISI